MSDDTIQPNDNETSVRRAPSWVAGARRTRAFWFGAARALQTPGWILLVSASGFGVLAQDAGLSLSQAFMIMALYFGLPAQVAVADQLARDASFWAAAIAVALTGIRLMPMTVTLMPFLTSPEASQPEQATDSPTTTPIKKPIRTGLSQLLAVHFIAVTAWFEGMAALPFLPPHLRIAHFIGIGAGLMAMTLIGTAAGFLLVEVVPPVVGAMLLFVSPAYFLLSLIESSRLPADKLAIVLGCALAPVLYLVLPDFDLLITGLLGGTLAYMFGRHKRTGSWLPGPSHLSGPTNPGNGKGGDNA